jgi:hypothetical protein
MAGSSPGHDGKIKIEHAKFLPDSRVLGTIIHEFARDNRIASSGTRGWSDQVRP